MPISSSLQEIQPVPPRPTRAAFAERLTSRTYGTFYSFVAVHQRNRCQRCSRAASIQLSTSPTNCCGYWARKAPLDDNCRYPSPTLSFRRSITLSLLPWTLTLPEILAEPTAELHCIACSQRLHGAMGISQLKAQLTNRTCARYTRSAPRETPGRNSLLP
jgi:hypothetical protein